MPAPGPLMLVRKEFTTYKMERPCSASGKRAKKDVCAYTLSSFISLVSATASIPKNRRRRPSLFFTGRLVVKAFYMS